MTNEDPEQIAFEVMHALVEEPMIGNPAMEILANAEAPPTKKWENTAQVVTKAWWEWHTSTYDGIRPSIEFKGALALSRSLLKAGYTANELLEGYKSLAMKATPTKARLMLACLKVRRGTAPKKVGDVFLMRCFHEQLRHQTGGPWMRNDDVGLSNIIQYLADRGKNDAQIYARLCLWAEVNPTEPILSGPILGLLNAEEDLIVKTLAWDEIERRAHNWKAMTL